MNGFVELVLTCGSWQEAQKIADSLLEKHLVACVEFMEVPSKYRGKSKLEHGKEMKLIMQSAAHLLAKIEAEIAALHSDETFMLQSLPVKHPSAKATDWLPNTLHLKDE